MKNAAILAWLLLLPAHLLPAQQQYSPGYVYAHVTGPSFTVVKTSSGVLHSISINSPASACTATVYDATTNSGTVIAAIDCAARQSFVYDVRMQTGLTVDLGTAQADLTVSYQ